MRIYLGVLFCVVIVGLGLRLRAGENPYATKGLCFSEDQPGADGRYDEFTPVRCSDSAPLGTAIGGEEVSLSFRDVNHDGRTDIVLTPTLWSSLFCLIGVCESSPRTAYMVQIRLDQNQRATKVELPQIPDGRP
jgi:hypothetical protein